MVATEVLAEPAKSSQKTKATTKFSQVKLSKQKTRKKGKKKGKTEIIGSDAVPATPFAESRFFGGIPILRAVEIH